MKILGHHRTNPFLRRRGGKKTVSPVPKEPHWLDIWLSRISHFSQFGLFVVTIGGLYFTVLPLYQKAVLEEAIARKELELKQYEKTLDEYYLRVRAFILKEFVFSAGAYCSGLMIPPPDLFRNSAQLGNRNYAEELLNINAGDCLLNSFQKSSLSKQLRTVDMQLLTAEIERTAADLKKKQDTAKKEYKSIPLRAKEDPRILEQITPLSQQMLKYLSETQPRAWFDANRFSIAVKERQLVIANEYAEYARNQIAALRNMSWGASK